MVNVQNIFYIIGIIFLFWAVAYFAYKYVFNLSNTLKTVILACLIIISYTLTEFMKDRGM